MGPGIQTQVTEVAWQAFLSMIKAPEDSVSHEELKRRDKVFQVIQEEPGLLMSTYRPNIWKAEAGGSLVCWGRAAFICIDDL